jgi:protein-tyrosine phosphatase
MREELYTISLPDCGPLSLMARPRGGEWLPDVVVSWQQAGISMVVSLLTQAEEWELDLSEEGALCQQHQIRFISLPIPDRQTPTNSGDVIQIIDEIAQHLREGKHVAIHCRMGIGRAAMIAASVLVVLGKQPDEAFALVEAARGCAVPDTEQQRAWVQMFSSSRRAAIQNPLLADTP